MVNTIPTKIISKPVVISIIINRCPPIKFVIIKLSILRGRLYMKNKFSQSKVLSLIKLAISIMMVVLLIYVAFLVTDTFLIMLNPKMGSVLIKIKSLFNFIGLLRMLSGSLFIVILSGALYLFGMVLDWFVSISKPESYFVQAYLNVSKFINRWYLIATISIWSLISLSDEAFNYFTILVSLIALLHEISSNSKSLQFKIISHHFLKNKGYLEEK